MNAIRRSTESGHAQHGWLDSFHSFSFADYYDPSHMGFGPLRVINEDRVQAGQGFGTHGHRDMEIISYVLEGSLAHKDSMGNGSVIRPGDVQRMSAGTGIHHSEFNGSKDEPVHFLQIWIEPDTRGIPPSYEEKRFDDASKRGQWRLIASKGGRDGSVTIHQDADVLISRLEAGESLNRELRADRRAYLHVIRGEARVNGERLGPGDAIKVERESEIKVDDARAADLLLFDLP